MTLPAVALFGLFIVWPIVTAVNYSRFNASGFGSETPIGFANYRQVAHDGTLYQALERNAYYAGAVALVSIAIGLLLAYQLYLRVQGWRFLQVAFMVPYILPFIVSGLLWEFMMDPQTGLFDSALRAVGLNGLQSAWLARPSSALVSVAIVQVWLNVPFTMLLLFAAMLGIPSEVLEAAEVDGAGRMRRLWTIVVPMIRRSLVLVTMIVLIQLVRSIDLIWILTRGGPLMSTTIATVYLYIQGFVNLNYGYANALGVVVGLVVGLATLVVLVLSRRRTGDVKEAKFG